MARIVVAAATSHTAFMIRGRDKAPKDQVAKVYDAFKEIGERFRKAGVDTIVVLSSDHLKIFFTDNMPSLCIGIGDRGQGEDAAGVPPHVVTQDSALAKHLLSYALDHDFDLAFSNEMPLDHGFIVPLHLMFDGCPDIPIVPIFVNSATLPLAPMERLYRFGQVLAEGIASWGENRRIALLATGGISHWVAVPRMGDINEDFDRLFLDLLLHKQDSTLLELSNAQVHDEAGNGALEIRSWMAVCGAVPNAHRELLCYEPMHDWVTGIAVMDFMKAED